MKPSLTLSRLWNQKRSKVVVNSKIPSVFIDRRDFVIYNNHMHTDQENKRDRRRQLREAEFGPERLIVSTCVNHHVLQCGHLVTVVATERENIKRRRCTHCKVVK